MIVIDWIPLSAPDNGDSDIIGYHVMWTLTTNQNWIDLNLPTTNYTNTTLNASQSLVKGLSYSFKVRARNVYGFGPFSEMTSILASTRPSAPV